MSGRLPCQLEFSPCLAARRAGCLRNEGNVKQDYFWKQWQARLTRPPALILATSSARPSPLGRERRPVKISGRCMGQMTDSTTARLACLSPAARGMMQKRASPTCSRFANDARG